MLGDCHCHGKEGCSMKKISTTGTRGFLEWMRANQPKIYAAFAKQLNTSSVVSGLGAVGDPIADSTTAATSQNWADSLQQLFMVASQAYLTKEQLSAQRKLLDVQLARAQQGLAPLDINMSQYGIAPSVGVGMTPDTKRFLTWAAIGAGVFFLAPRLLGSRR